MLNKLSKLTAIIILMVFASSNAVAQQIKFAKDKADLHEYLKIKKIDAKKISYEIYMVNGECAEFKHKGTATLSSSNLGTESDIDEYSNGYEVKEYFDKSKTCYISIRIGNEKGYTNRARFIIADCTSKSPCKTESENLIKSN
jgi:hypothetical protein